MHKDYLSKETEERKEGLRYLDGARVQNKIERRKQACTGERRGSSRRIRLQRAGVEPKQQVAKCVLVFYQGFLSK